MSTGGILALVGVAGVASSTHPSLALYLVALLAFVLLAVGRLTGVTLAEGATAGRPEAAWPPLRLVVGSVLVAVLAAVPCLRCCRGCARRSRPPRLPGVR